MEEWFSVHWFYIDTLRNFTWEQPLLLYAILGIPFLFILRWVFQSRSKHRLELPIQEIRFQQNWFNAFVGYLRHLPTVTLFLAATLGILALARPQTVKESKTTYSEGIDIVLAIDISESMQEKDMVPNRLAAAKNIAKKFISQRKDDRIGLVLFAGQAFSLCPLTNDKEALLDFVDEINFNLIKTSGTAIGDAIATSINRLREVESKQKVTILLSDGENTAGSLDPSTAADLAKSFDIRFYTILVGTNASKTNVIDESTLKEIANITKGLFFRATDNESLGQTFQEINRLEQSKVKDERFREIKDYYDIYLKWAIVFFLITLFFKSTFMSNILED